MTDAILPSPRPAFIARVISLIMSPAFSATMVAPTILSDPLTTWIRTTPDVSPSHIARSLSARCFSNVSTSMPLASASFSYSPTWASSGSVYVHQGMIRLENFSLPKNKALRITARAMKSETCVNLNSDETSPMAKTFGLDVFRLSSILIPVFGSYSTLATSRFRLETLGARPAATIMASNKNSCIILFSLMTSCAWSPLRLEPSYSELRWNSTPSSFSDFKTIADKSLSSLGMTVPERPKTTTSDPRR
mmetsp:Transcript_18783/g.46137  ORF Transcript_18783/g.46137 Transcript_18783/m.46137 type:complete len:249 (+) Transcript_18783:155-901(+)